MQIRSIHIREFGGINDLSLDFSEGLNLILGNNESGKSTVVAFIRFMFYGLPKRVAGEALSDGERAFSWKNGIADGSLTLDCKGKRYRIERRESSSGTKKLLQIIDESTGLQLPKGATPESEFLRIPLSVFDSTACIRQLRAGTFHSDGLSSSIENLLLAGDESTDVDHALRDLNEARKTLSHIRGRGGEIPALEDEISALRSQLSEIQTIEEERIRTQGDLERYTSDLEGKKRSYQHIECMLEYIAIAYTLQQFDTLHSEEAEIQAKEKKLEETQASIAMLGKDPVGMLSLLDTSADELVQSLNNEQNLERELSTARNARRGDPDAVETAKQIQRDGGSTLITKRISAAFEAVKRTKRRPAIFLALSILILLASVLTSVLLESPLLLLPSVCAVITLVLAVFSRKKKRIAEAELRSILTRYRVAVSSPDPTGEFQILASRAQTALETEENYLTSVGSAEEQLHAAKRKNETYLKDLQIRFGVLLVSGMPITPQALRTISSNLRLNYHTYENQQDTLLRQKEKCSRQKHALSEYDEEALRAKLATLPFAEITAEGDLKAKKASLQSQIEALQEQIRSAELTVARLNAVRQSPESILQEIADTSELCTEKRKKLNAILLASAAITEARDHLHQNFTPRLRQHAGALLQTLSCNAYGSVAVENDFSLTLTAGESGEVHPIAAFSGGTRDVTYTALRLALCDLLAVGGTTLPILLDETLAQLDDTRAKALLSLLLMRANTAETQFLLFTCHTRERTLLEGENVNVITLS